MQSTDVAALSAMIAKSYTSLESDSALLAGLTHSIGLSPILVKAEGDSNLLNDTQALDNLIYDLYPVVGAEILKNWGFSEHLIQVPAQHLNLERTGNNGKADYTDIVQVALIQTVAGTSHPLACVGQENVSALDRLSMRGSVEEIDMAGGIIEVEEIREAIL
ncbi:MAG: HDOD domain-containing protein [Gammaproteobacteria bacterium]